MHGVSMLPLCEEEIFPAGIPTEANAGHHIAARHLVQTTSVKYEVMNPTEYFRYPRILRAANDLDKIISLKHYC